MIKPLNIFYEEPDPDRWFPFDRYLRKIVRRIVRGKPKIGGVQMVALELMRGLEKIGQPYRFNDYKYISCNPKEIACVIGKPHIIFEKRIKNPILFGAGVYSHPTECPDLFEKYPNVKLFLVPGEWMRNMYKPFYGDKVIAWPVGIDTEKWIPTITDKPIDILIYDKIRWHQSEFEISLMQPIKDYLSTHNFSYDYIQYGHYKPEDLQEKITKAKAVIFLCEHETQGIAYQQILSTNTPIFAWDSSGYWQDPYYYPHKVKYKPVSSVPYWDDRCGMKFKDFETFEMNFDRFFQKLKNHEFSPREYILENLTLEICARKYLDILKLMN
jgi:hypothetical protein